VRLLAAILLACSSVALGQVMLKQNGTDVGTITSLNCVGVACTRVAPYGGVITFDGGGGTAFDAGSGFVALVGDDTKLGGLTILDAGYLGIVVTDGFIARLNLQSRMGTGTSEGRTEIAFWNKNFGTLMAAITAETYSNSVGAPLIGSLFIANASQMGLGTTRAPISFLRIPGADPCLGDEYMRLQPFNGSLNMGIGGGFCVTYSGTQGPRERVDISSGNIALRDGGIIHGDSSYQNTAAWNNTLNEIGSVPNAYGATLTNPNGQMITLQPAGGEDPADAGSILRGGVVSTGQQSWTGRKVFMSEAVFDAGIRFGGGSTQSTGAQAVWSASWGNQPIPEGVYVMPLRGLRGTLGDIICTPSVAGTATVGQSATLIIDNAADGGVVRTCGFNCDDAAGTALVCSGSAYQFDPGSVYDWAATSATTCTINPQLTCSAVINF
jgi:hypothetical protein